MKRLFSLLLAVTLAFSTIPAAAAQTEPGEEEAGFFDDITDYVTERVEEINEKVNDLKDNASSVAGQVKDNASSLAGQVKDNASSLVGQVKEKASDTADTAISSVSEAYNAAVDSAGNVINMATEKVSDVKDSVQEAVRVIEENGAEIMAAIEKVLDYMDLGEPQNMERARSAVEEIVTRLYDSGMLSDRISKEGLHTLADIVFATTVYGYLYNKGEITLQEYTSLMSEILIKEGVPAGVGFIAEKLPIPGGGAIAKKVVSYLISSVYGNGEEELPAVDSEPILPDSESQSPVFELQSPVPESLAPESESMTPDSRESVDSSGTVQLVTESEAKNNHTEEPRVTIEDPIEDAPLGFVEDPLEDAPLAVLGDPVQEF